MAIKDLLVELAKDYHKFPDMADHELLQIVRRHGFELCDVIPVGWAAHKNVISAHINGGIIGLGSEEGAVVYDGETWYNADQPLFSPSFCSNSHSENRSVCQTAQT